MRYTGHLNLNDVSTSCNYEVRGETLTLSEIKVAGLDWNLFPASIQDEVLNFLTIVVRDYHSKRGNDVAF